MPQENSTAPSNSNSTSCHELEVSSLILSTQGLVTATGVAMTLMVILGLLGNLAVIFGLVKFGRATNPYFFIITIMAVIDLLVCLIDVPLYGIFTLNKFRWPVARQLCKPYLILDYQLCSMSSYCVAILSYDRSVLVMEPLRYQKLQTRRKVSAILLCCLILANFHTPFILFWPNSGGSNTSANCEVGCSVQYEDSLALQLCGVLIQFFLPFAATVISSCLVYARMRERKQLFFTLQGGIAQFAGQDRMFRLADKASRKAGKWLILFDSIYTIMWLPCMSMVVIRTLVSRELFEPTRLMFHLFQLCWWLLLCNSVVNPFLYIRSCDPVCNFYMGMLTCQSCRRRPPVRRPIRGVGFGDGCGASLPMRPLNGTAAPVRADTRRLLQPDPDSGRNGKRKLSIVAVVLSASRSRADDEAGDSNEPVLV